MDSSAVTAAALTSFFGSQISPDTTGMRSTSDRPTAFGDDLAKPANALRLASFCAGFIELDMPCIRLGSTCTALHAGNPDTTASSTSQRNAKRRNP